MKMSIRAARIIAGYTQKELGDKLGVCGSTVSKFETGVWRVSKMYLLALAYVTGVPVEDLIVPEDSTKHVRNA